jgi:hypothetical protein
MENTSDMKVQVKLELKPGTESISDSKMFSALQSELERMKERAQLLRKRVLPIRKRLRKRMEDEQLQQLRCGNFVLEMEVDSDSEPEETGDAVFTRERVLNHFGDEQFESYCVSNQRAKRKRRKLNCRRDVVSVDNSDAEI